MPPKKKSQQKQDGTESDLSKLKVEELRTLCKKRGLETAGRKSELVDRLQKSDEDAAAGGKKVSLFYGQMIIFRMIMQALPKGNGSSSVAKFTYSRAESK